MMRVSSTQIMDSSLFGIMSSYSRFDEAQNEMNTGKIVNEPSDNPSGTAQAMNYQQRISEMDQYERNMDQAKGFLSTSESALDSITSLVRQARSIAIQGANDTQDPSTRQALAGQIQSMIDQIAIIGNTSYGNRNVFAGQETTTQAFVGSSLGYSYQGGTAAKQTGDLIVDVGRGEQMKINVTGDTVIAPLIQDQAGPPVVKSVLAQLRDDLTYSGVQGGTVSRVDIANLDTQLANLSTVRADMGSKLQLIDQSRSRMEISRVNFTQFISNIVDADIPTTMVKLQTAQTAYQASLQSTARAFQSTLMDFLR